MSEKKDTAALVPLTQTHQALQTADDIRAIVEDNFDGGATLSPFNLERIKLGTGGATVFTVIDEEGKEENPKSVEAVIVFSKRERSFWMKGLDDGGEKGPPDCSSPDLRIGYGNNGDSDGKHNCASCPMNQWGSDRRGRKGKACSERHIFFLLRKGREEFIFPSLLIAPVGSLGNITKYLTRLTSQRIQKSQVLHRFELEKAESGGHPFARLKLSMVRRLDADEIAGLATYAQNLRTVFEAMHISKDDGRQAESPEPRTIDVEPSKPSGEFFAEFSDAK